jgi:hypothetical protein
VRWLSGFGIKGSRMAHCSSVSCSRRFFISTDYNFLNQINALNNKAIQPDL